MMEESPKIVGLWKTVDDETGEEKSYVRIQKQDEKKWEAVIEKLLKFPQDTKLKNGRYAGCLAVGSRVILDLVPYENYWAYGIIIDPMSGSEYTCSVWFENNNFDELIVRGTHWSGIFRTQKWYRAQ
jgi:uncharacterized protein (DUF2147 family)